jgi:hypothetical protein
MVKVMFRWLKILIISILLYCGLKALGFSLGWMALGSLTFIPLLGNLVPVLAFGIDVAFYDMVISGVVWIYQHVLI